MKPTAARPINYNSRYGQSSKLNVTSLFKVCKGPLTLEGRVGNYGIGGEGGSEDVKGGFSVTALVFGANLLKRSLSVIGGNTRGSDTLTIDLVRDKRGIYLT